MPKTQFDAFKGKSVLVTGHTGFKGSWLTAWLVKLGAQVVGIALDPPTQPSHFDSLGISVGISDFRVDIRHQAKIENIIIETKPNYIFHLAAQSLVHKSYQDPVTTWETNVMGTINILESLRKLNHSCAVVIITSDKCYKNIEQTEGYVETDELGGFDPYSASKSSAEIAISSYIKSYFPSDESTVRIASARAGNVIGGGDWSNNRLVPDCVKSWSKNDQVKLRYPNATRPWQHVLEPLSGYLTLAIALNDQVRLHGEAFNFGPQPTEVYTVFELVKEMSNYWDKVKWEIDSNISARFYESSLLRLDCTKALEILNWQATMNFKETVRMTSNWYKTYYTSQNYCINKTNEQIDSYIMLAKQKKLLWAF
jgi:CDP-glucose 4,6-dehydratase